MKILNFGSMNIDNVYSVQHFVLPGETISSKALKEFCGGKGLNQSVALSRAGVKVFHAGLIGEDGEILYDICKENNIDTRFIKRVEGRSGHTIIQVDENGQNSIILFGGANRKIEKAFVDEVLDNFQKDDVILLQNEINELDYIINRAFDKKMKIVLNPSPMDEKIKEIDLSKIYMFILNEIEGQQLTGEKSVNKILEEILKPYPDAKVVFTLGKDGSIYKDKEKEIKQAAFNVKVVDTTAAGDTFTGYFIQGYLQGVAINEVLGRSSKAAAIAVTKHGALDSIPYQGEIDSYSF